MAAASVKVTVGGAEYIPRMANIIALAFQKDPINRYFVLTEGDLPNDAVVPHETRVQATQGRLEKRIVVKPELVEAGDWAAGAVWFPPGVKLPPLDRATTSEAALEFYDTFLRLKKKYLGDRDYWYLNLLGRDPSRTDPGVVSAILKIYLDKARADGVPAWVEASGTHSRDIYTHFGFRFVEEAKIGAGKADKDGYRVEGGEGVSIYAMIFEP